jgi:hypothetical protein
MSEPRIHHHHACPIPECDYNPTAWDDRQLALAHNPSCGCGCNDYEPRGCPVPGPGVDNRWCVNYPTLNCHCIALVSQGYCEGCYVATK